MFSSTVCLEAREDFRVVLMTPASLVGRVLEFDFDLSQWRPSSFFDYPALHGEGQKSIGNVWSEEHSRLNSEGQFPLSNGEKRRRDRQKAQTW